LQRCIFVLSLQFRNIGFGTARFGTARYFIQNKKI